MLFLPVEFGGREIPENTVYIPPFVLEEKRRIDLDIVAELVRVGKAKCYQANPEYQGTSGVPIAIHIRAYMPGEFKAVIAIWGDALRKYSNPQ